LAHLRRLRFVHSYLDRHGRPRHYFRREGDKQIPLPGPFGSEAFMRAYQMALGSSASAPAEALSLTVPGTVNALVVSYYRSEAWLALEEETRKTRQRVIEKWRARCGGFPVKALKRKNVLDMLAEITGASARRSWFKAVRPVLQHAVPIMLREDPTFGIATPKLPKTKGHHSWTDAEIERYRAYWRCGTQQRLVFEFALEAVSRRGEVVALGPQHVYAAPDGKRWIRIARIHGSDDVDIPVSPDLAAAIDAMPRSHLTFITTAYGKPRSKKGLGTDFAGWARAAGLPDHCRLHGLKKAGMRRLAEDGNTTHELMAQSGHKTLSEVERYTKGASQKTLAGTGAAKRRRGQSGNSQLANLNEGLANLPAKSLK
jgi:integrase